MEVNGNVTSTLHKGAYKGSLISQGSVNKLGIVIGPPENLQEMHDCDLHLEKNEPPCNLIWRFDEFECFVNSCIPKGTLSGNGVVMPTLDNKTVAALSYSSIVTEDTGLFAPKNIAKHHRVCSGRVANMYPVAKVAKLAGKYIPKDAPLESYLLDTLLGELRDGEASATIKNDYALRLFAKKLAVAHKTSKHHSANNRQVLRRCARLLMEIRQIDSTIKHFEDVLQPDKYEIVIQSIYNMCILKGANFEFGLPTIASQLNHYLKELPQLLRTEYLKQGYADDSLQIQRLKNFLVVHDREFNVYISKSANTTAIKNRFKKKTILPSTEDIVLFNTYIKTMAMNSYDDLLKHGFDNYKLEIMLAKHYQKMEVLGKRERRLPVLLNLTQITYLNLLLKYRVAFGVSEDNEFLFGTSFKLGHLDASVVIRQFSEQCGATNPTSLRGTLLRKQVATLSQMLHLNENEMQQLADYMGHDFEVHKSYYRKPELNQQTTVLAKFFMTVGDVDVAKYKGKSISELEVIVPQTNYEEENYSDLEENIADPKTYGSDEHSTISENENAPKDKEPDELSTHATLQGGNVEADKGANLTSTKKRRAKLTWTPVQKRLMYEQFSKYLKPNSAYPSLKLCGNIAEKYSALLSGRNARCIYGWVQGEKRRLKSQTK
ncbi:hypothetical protein FQR65_LT15671 [Abscondita terminalis]|nr:hypothetical protein FQR65_LT15671 [Abscondita terminalis]